MSLLLPTIAIQLDVMTSLLGVVAAIAGSFAIITVVASYYRFQSIVKQAEDTQPEDMGSSTEEVLRVQFARYLAGCSRRGTSFSISLVRLAESNAEVRMDAPVVRMIKETLRRDDIVCVFDKRTVALLIETEPEDSESILRRVIAAIAKERPEITVEEIRAGVASYPEHGLSGKELIEVAVEGLAEATAEQSIVMPEIVKEEDEDEDAGAEETEDDEEESSRRGWREARKNSMLDDLTGVLKPAAISPYMQRVMSECRRKKQQMALFCVGVNNMDHLSRFHGEDAADDVIAGVSGVLQKNLRADDLIGRHEKHAFLVLARCSLEEAEVIGRRVSILTQNALFESGRKKLKTTVTLGVAAFPEHGRNLHLLYLAGQRVLDHSRANDIRAYAVYDPIIHDKVSTKPMKSIKSINA